MRFVARSRYCLGGQRAARAVHQSGRVTCSPLALAILIVLGLFVSLVRCSTRTCGEAWLMADKEPNGETMEVRGTRL